MVSANTIYNVNLNKSVNYMYMLMLCTNAFDIYYAYLKIVNQHKVM